jgi:hypothetical protein
MTQEVRVGKGPRANPPAGVRTKAQVAIGVRVLVMGSFNVCRCREPVGWQHPQPGLQTRVSAEKAERE